MCCKLVDVLSAQPCRPQSCLYRVVGGRATKSTEVRSSDLGYCFRLLSTLAPSTFCQDGIQLAFKDPKVPIFMLVIGDCYSRLLDGGHLADGSVTVSYLFDTYSLHLVNRSVVRGIMVNSLPSLPLPQQTRFELKNVLCMQTLLGKDVSIRLLYGRSSWLSVDDGDHSKILLNVPHDVWNRGTYPPALKFDFRPV